MELFRLFNKSSQMDTEKHNANIIIISINNIYITLVFLFNVIILFIEYYRVLLSFSPNMFVKFNFLLSFKCNLDIICIDNIIIKI